MDAISAPEWKPDTSSKSMYPASSSEPECHLTYPRVSQSAIYEQIPGGSFTPGTYFYGAGLYEGGSASPPQAVGLALYGGTGASLPNQSGIGSGVAPHLLVTPAGRVAVGNTLPSKAG